MKYQKASKYLSNNVQIFPQNFLLRNSLIFIRRKKHNKLLFLKCTENLSKQCIDLAFKNMDQKNTSCVQTELDVVRNNEISSLDITQHCSQMSQELSGVRWTFLSQAGWLKLCSVRCNEKLFPSNDSMVVQPRLNI